MKRILITGIAGFIGFSLAKKLVTQNFLIFGLDNLNTYYDVDLKFARLKELGIDNKKIDLNNSLLQSKSFKNLFFTKII